MECSPEWGMQPAERRGCVGCMRLQAAAAGLAGVLVGAVLSAPVGADAAIGDPIIQGQVNKSWGPTVLDQEDDPRDGGPILVVRHGFEADHAYAEDLTATRADFASTTLKNVRFRPTNAATHPKSGQKGELFMDRSGRLWLCRSGTWWVQLG